MSDVSASPQDPVFYMHHTFVDHGFRLWQNLDASRVSTINGNDAQGNPLTLNTMLDVGGLGPTIPISAVMNTLSGTVINGVSFCYKYTY
jgi:tyrosinase